MKRPTGVTIIAVLAIIGGVLELLGSLAYFRISFLGLGAYTGPVLATAASSALTVGVVMVIIGVLELAFGVGALRLSHWAWTFGVIVFAIGLVLSVVQLFMFGLVAGPVVWAIVDAVILGYLYSHSVREAFGHLPSSTAGTGHPTAA